VQLVQVSEENRTTPASLASLTSRDNRLHHPVKNDDALARYQAQTLRCHDVLEEQLKKTDGASVLPGGYCAVDFHFQPWIFLYDFAGLTLDKHPLIMKWLRMLGEVKQVKEAYRRIKEAAEGQS
jgi:glutathione S-transferase